MKKTVLTICLVMMGLLIVSCQMARIVNPGPISVRTPSAEQMRTAIGQALRNRGWAIAREEPGQIDATLFIRSHVAKIRIDYDAEKFSIAYLESTNLDYMKKGDGSEYIHENYNGWIQNLVHDISVFASHAG